MNEIVKLGHPSLNIKSVKIDDFNDSISKLIDHMLSIMYDAHGVGLAAPQISKNIRLFVYDVGDGPRHCINPKLKKRSEKIIIEEGCLSIPGYYYSIKRYDYVCVEALNFKQEIEIHEGDELIGRVLQHEIDHLNGKLLLSRLKRKERTLALADIHKNGLPGPYAN